MKLIYMEHTLNLLASEGYQPLEQLDALVKSGEVKRTENEINYLLIDDGDRIK